MTDNTDDAILLWNAAANHLEKLREEINTLKAALKNSEERQDSLFVTLRLAKEEILKDNARQKKLEADLDEARRIARYYYKLAKQTLVNEFEE